MKIITAFFVILLYLLFSESANASESNGMAMAHKRAQKAIDVCWAISQEDRDSGITSRMRQGTIDTATCMEQHIIYLAETHLYPKSPILVEETRQDLEAISNKYGNFYWNLYNSIDICRPSCGTMHYVRSDAKHASLLENMIHDIYVQMYFERILTE